MAVERSAGATDGPLGLDRFPRVELCHRPTPLEPLPRLSHHLGGPSLWVKRDDCTGLATGGNKARKLEFLLGQALAEGADTVVTIGAPQSNHVRQTAAAAARLGLACHGVIERWDPGPTSDYLETGNVLVDRLVGLRFEWQPPGTDLAVAAAAVVERLSAEGRRPYLIPTGGSNPVGALGYVEAADEITAQSTALDVGFAAIVVATGSAGTHAGLLAGFRAIGRTPTILGVSVRRRSDELAGIVHGLATETGELIGAPTVDRTAVLVDDRSVGAGYGVPGDDTVEAIELAAGHEGLLLDPVYTGKAMAGLIRAIRDGRFDPSDDVLFVHTGGAAALFAYRDRLAPTPNGERITP